MAKPVNNGAKSPAFRSTIKPNQIGKVDPVIKNHKLRKEMKKFYSKQRRGNFKQLDYGLVSS